MPAAAHRIARRGRRLEHYAPTWMAPATARLWLDTEAGYAWKSLPGPRWWAYLVEAVVLGLGPALVYEQSRRRAAMVGLRARHPLVDVDVVELVLGLDPELAFDSRLSRPLLRDAVHGLLPEEVRLRQGKSNFDAVFHAALAGPDLPFLREILGARDAEIGAYIDLAEVRRDLLEPEPPTGTWRRTWAVRLWRMVMAECWLRAQREIGFVSQFADRLPSPDMEFVADDGTVAGRVHI